MKGASAVLRRLHRDRRSITSHREGAAACTQLDGVSLIASAQQQNQPVLSQLGPELQTQWDHQRNSHLGALTLKPCSQHKVWWLCTKCPDGNPHSWQAPVQSRTKSRGCPFCSGRYVCSHNSLARKAPNLAKEWDTERNPDSPSDYTFSSAHQPHWICHYGHQWQAKICNRARKTGCPVCALRLQGEGKLPVLTASSSHIMQLWDWEQNAKCSLDPSKITCGSQKEAWFKCNQCPESALHQWTARVWSVVRGSGCPFCSGQRVCKCNSLQTVRPDVAAEWCYANNSGTPDSYTARSKADVWWQNDRRGIWQESINSRFQSSINVKVQSSKCLACNTESKADC